MSGQKPKEVSKEFSLDLHDEIVARHGSEKGCIISMSVPRSTVASIMVMKKFGTSRTPRMSNQARNALVREVTNNTMFILIETQRSSAEMGEPAINQPNIKASF